MTSDPYFIDYPGRIKAIQLEMKKDGVDVYLGSRLRTLSWTTDSFFPWRSGISGREIAFGPWGWGARKRSRIFLWMKKSPGLSAGERPSW